MQQEKSGTILWLTGWSFPNTVFDRLHSLLPEFHHITVDYYSTAATPEEMLKLTERAVRDDLSLHAASTAKGPLLIAGWSLGALLALRLAEKAGADGLLLLAGTARFTRPKEQKDRGWPDAHVRQMIKSLMKDRQEAETKFRQSVFTEAEWEAGLGATLPPAGGWTTSALIAGLQILQSEECLSLLPEMVRPALLIHGTEDHICPFGAAEELESLLPHAQLLSLTGCGHAPFAGREAYIAEALRRWWLEQQEKRYSTTI
ncbi:MAG TPA: alpha/beta hydrolase [Candidatus Udaeobacter sp.]|jgi:pimeloyl-[acyl-carrier protein] methyl ester esterase|nr:alpha/beta hydrolase [Candidatus Udaeobacter sp.]